MASDITITSLDVVGGVGSFVASAAWTAPNGLGCLSYMQPSAFRFYYGTSSNFANAALAGEAAIGLYNKGGLAKGTTYYVWARAVDSSGNEGDVYPSGAGVQVTTLTTDPGPNSVGSTELQNNAVDNNHLRSNAVTTSKLDAGSVTAQKIATNAVTADKISVNNLSAISAELGNVLVNGNLIVGGTISTGKIAEGACAAATMSGTSSFRGPGQTIQSQNIFVVSGFVAVDVFCVLERPTEHSANFGTLTLRIYRNGSQIATRSMFYDDNFAYPMAFSHRDTPPANQNSTYTMVATNDSGSGFWRVTNGVIRLMNFKV